MFHSLINVIEQVHVSSQNTAVKQWRLYLWHMKGHFVILSHKTFLAMNLRKKKAL